MGFSPCGFRVYSIAEAFAMIDFGVTEQKATELQRRMQACGLCEQDLQETFVRSGGAGGQHVNKTSTCVVLTHVPTGLCAKVQDSRSQALNRYHARKRLCEALEARLLGKESPQAQQIAKLRKQKDRRRRRHNKHIGPQSL